MSDTWQLFCKQYCAHPGLGLRLDISKMELPDDFVRQMQAPMDQALEAMAALEAGAIANPDEGRQVGHYWLRAPGLAPTAEQTTAIEESVRAVTDFAREVHDGSVSPTDGQRFEHLLIVGIGGSALGPQLVADALGDHQHDQMTVHFLDNTDPDGIARVLGRLESHLGHTLTLVISKSGGTPETRNGMLLAKAAYAEQGIDFARHAVAITGDDSKLDLLAQEEGWLARFPMWDWVGGRTSVTSAVGLLPAALQGIDIAALLEGARQCDAVTRDRQVSRNPAALLALCWHHATGGQGERDMVILPYKDRLILLSRYLQQLVMESLGKGTDLEGRPVAQGIAVYGNKGSTDQHAYVQQLREGVDNFFATFIEVLEDGGSASELEPGITAGDYLRGFRLGTREALACAGRRSISLTIERVDAHALGVLIALFERAVGLYASLVQINAYHQPGVEAGKKAAAVVLELQHLVLAEMASTWQPRSAMGIATALGRPEQTETIFHLLEALAFNQRGVVRQLANDEHPCAATYHLG